MGLLQLLLEILGCSTDGDTARLQFLVLQLFFIGHFLLRKLDIIFLAEILQGFNKAHLLVLHQEPEHVSTFSAYKTMAHLLHRRDVERGILVVMERADGFIAYSCLFECKELANHIYYVGSVLNFVYSLL